MTPESSRVLTVEETARVLRISRSAAYRAVAAGDIPSIRLGARSVRVPAHALARLLGEIQGRDAERSEREVLEQFVRTAGGK